MDNWLNTLLGELKNGLDALYGERLKAVYLYGSYARGEQDNGSDVDILVILDPFDHYRAEIERTSYLIAELSLKYGVSISRVFVSQKDWANRESPFLANAREEAIAA